MKRSVCLDCYRQSFFHGAMTLEDALREIGSIPGVTGVDAVTEMLLPDYPEVSDGFLERWREGLARAGLIPVTLGSFIDRLRFRDHVMDETETAAELRRDVSIAARLGFQNLRIMHDIPLGAVEQVLPLAEELDVCLLDEVMPPGTIRPAGGRKGMDCQNDLELIARTGTKHFGLVVNLGLFQTEPNPTQLLDVLLRTRSPIMAAHDLESIMACFHTLEFSDFELWMGRKYPMLTENRELFCRMFGVRVFGDPVETGDLSLIAPHIRDVYAKFFRMYPEPESPAGWLEPSIPYEEVVHALTQAGYDGPLATLRMSFPTLSLGAERTPAEISREEREQVRRHQALLSHLID